MTSACGATVNAFTDRHTEMAMALVLFVFGVALGAVAGWALVRRNAQIARKAALAQTVAVHELELRSQAERHEAELARLDERMEARAQQHRAEVAAAEQRVDLVRGDREQLRRDVQAVSADVLATTGEALTREIAAQRLADHERAAGELARRTEEIKHAVEPIGLKLGQMEGKVEQLERQRREADGRLGETLRSLQEGVGSLAAQASNLTSALRRPSTRGAWGEIQLRNVIEMAGMVEHCDFTTQTTIYTDDGRLRPDVLVRLPGGKLVVIDAKVPLEAFLAAQDGDDDEQREIALAHHARQTREHITKLASKGYQSQFDTTPELVVMFLPSEGIYHAALAADPALLEYGVTQQVLIATPTTLIALLRAIHYGWRQELIAESAREIADIGRELHRRLAIFAEPLAKVGRQLGSAVVAYNEAVGSFDRRVVPQLRRIEQAGASSDRGLPARLAVEEAPRSPSADLGLGDGAELRHLAAGGPDAFDQVA
jgi:DNA recombination protein RmuC